MKKQINLVAVMLFVIALASLVAAVKLGHGHGGNTYGFSSGG
ncbi:MAG TPA: hypothetical protein VNR59_09590 [Gaiellaceae bacterium]|nr:hypothetical protein [Gaiellaceae bacterium]